MGIIYVYVKDGNNGRILIGPSYSAYEVITDDRLNDADWAKEIDEKYKN